MSIQSTVSINEFLQLLSINFAAGLPVEARGASGIGKTEVALQYAAMQGEDYGLWELNCATASLPDVIGFMLTMQEQYTLPDGQSHSITAAHFAYPYFMRDKRDGKPAFLKRRGLVVFEEYGQAQPDVKRALAPCIWEKRVGQHLFPAGTDVLLLSNRPEDRSGVTKDFDFLINRRCVLNIRADLDSWLVWALDHGVSNTAMAFAARNEAIVFANKAPKEQGPWMTPRSLVSLDRAVQEAEKRGMPLDHNTVRLNANGIVGEGAAHAYIAFAAIRDSLPTLAQILGDPKKAPMPVEADKQMFLAFDLASKTNVNNVLPITTYIDRMPTDFGVAYFRAAVQRDTSLRSTKQFGDWAMKNVQLLSAVAQN